MAFHSSDAIAGAYGLVANSPTYDDTADYYNFRAHSGANARGIMVLKFRVSGISSGYQIDQATIRFVGASNSNDFSGTEFFLENDLSEITLENSAGNRPVDYLTAANSVGSIGGVSLYDDHDNTTELDLAGTDVETGDVFHSLDFSARLQTLVNDPSWSAVDQDVAIVFYGVTDTIPRVAQVYSLAFGTTAYHPEIHITYTAIAATELPSEAASSDLSLTVGSADEPHLVLIGAGQQELYIQPSIDDADPLLSAGVPAGPTSLPDQGGTAPSIDFSIGGTRDPIYTPQPGELGPQAATSTLTLTLATTDAPESNELGPQAATLDLTITSNVTSAVTETPPPFAASMDDPSIPSMPSYGPK